MGFAICVCALSAAMLMMGEFTMARQGVFYPFGPGDSYSARADDGWAFTNIAQPFTYFGYTSSQIYVNSNGFLTFDSGSSRYSPYRFPGGTRNIVSPFWTDLENRYSGTISYREYNSGSVLQQASTDINLYFPGISFSASWVFVATWDKVEYYWSSGTEISFQVVLISDYERSFTLMNYGAISATGLNVQAGYDTIKSTHHFSIPGSFMSNITDFRNTSNVNRPGRWAFQINDPCEEMDCTEDEWCGETDGVYGCFCKEDHPRPHAESYDSVEYCSSSTGTMSLSRCQLFEEGFSAVALHLNDPSCNGTLQDGRVEFLFDNENHTCGTTLRSNSTHFIYENLIQGEANSAGGPISRERRIQLLFCCVYPLTQALSMDMDINPLESVVTKKLPGGQGTYRVRMIPYEDAGFSHAFSGNVTVAVNQRMYVAVRLDGVDSRQIALVMDSCWATPVNQADYHIRWDLIRNECPNPDDDTVELLQNGNSTSGRFSFKMFFFVANTSKVYLHCSIHLCLVASNDCTAHCYPGYPQRKRRSVDFHDSASISLGPLVWASGRADGRDVKAPNPVRVSKASGQFLAMKKRKKLLRADKH